MRGEPGSLAKSLRLSALQRYILLSCYDAKSHRRERKGLEQFYQTQPRCPSPKDAQDAVTKSLERLIDKELLVGYGVRTPHKWYIREIRLTPKGRRVSRALTGWQAPLPFRARTRRMVQNQTPEDGR